MTDRTELRRAEREALYAPDRRLNAYYFSFDSTGSPIIDAILSAVAIAGKSHHSTNAWTEDDEWSRWGEGRSLVDVIQAAANEAANKLTAAEAALARVREMHQPYKVYDECDCDDDAKNDGRHVEVEAALATSSTGISCFGWTCNHLYTACDECCTEGMGYITEHCAIYHDHGPDKPICPTIRALDATTGGES